ncbi:hypothetical protein M441DRAFT_296691 [Trichoderma asperellum CBS 433.97]|uniref:Secreted protein n=1 Tax=Trichoderma asperellum (strain ATCC 204424 / CBS 433.97 / NBRC 101777) TaxID=1042311 RepID=A0A2T3YSR9_TRIA4|nr:hypothetical protein M441DRAFT_296691 [Trichoderma asperellum CBS 433.97]PTB35618.1 hypothetical protein M441DRAFT_296691 [Trichoderma asperellum CBS 433.97]
MEWRYQGSISSFVLLIHQVCCFTVCGASASCGAVEQRPHSAASGAAAPLAHHLQRPYSAPAPQSPAPTRTVLISALGWACVLPPSTADQAITSLNGQTSQPTTSPASSSSNHHTDVQLRSALPAPFFCGPARFLT